MISVLNLKLDKYEKEIQLVFFSILPINKFILTKFDLKSINCTVKFGNIENCANVFILLLDNIIPLIFLNISGQFPIVSANNVNVVLFAKFITISANTKE